MSHDDCPDIPEHHRKWLEAHPDRDLAWLRQKTADGFHVHHVDGDATNNDPNNLVLIEGRDHFMLHSGKRPMRRGPGIRAGRRRERLATLPDGTSIRLLPRERAAIAIRRCLEVGTPTWRTIGLNEGQAKG